MVEEFTKLDSRFEEIKQDLNSQRRSFELVENMLHYVSENLRKDSIILKACHRNGDVYGNIGTFCFEGDCTPNYLNATHHGMSFPVIKSVDFRFPKDIKFPRFCVKTFKTEMRKLDVKPQNSIFIDERIPKHLKGKYLSFLEKYPSLSDREQSYY
jgi:hypothetical protein